MIPSARPYLTEKEVQAARRAILSGWVTQGPCVQRFEEAFKRYVGAKQACAVSSCTAALHLALQTIGVKPGNAVITVSHSFIATANCIRYCLAEPVFVDINLETYNMAPEALSQCLENDCEWHSGRLYYKHFAKLINKESPLRHFTKDSLKKNPEFGRVRAILVVHQMGMPCDLGRILPLAEKFHLPVVEDAACAVGSEITVDNGGTWKKIGLPHGDLACFSFHPLKVLTTGEGGMLTTNHIEYDKALRLLRHQGMSISDLNRHQSRRILIEQYPYVGYNYRMTDIQAAIGIEQLKKLPSVIAKRRSLVSYYQEALSKILWLEVPREPNYCRTNWQSFPVRVLDHAPLHRNQLMQYLRNHGVLTRLGIMNAHREKPYRRKGFTLPNSELARDSVMLLPLFYTMKDREMKRVIKLLEFGKFLKILS